jgi:excisionase family DNA binding protein
MDDTLLSPEDVAERLGISRLTAVRWLRSGKLKGQKMGRKTVRMKASDLEAFINQQRPSLTLVGAIAPAHESAQVPDQRLDADTLALVEKLRHPGESLSAVVQRVFQQALQAQDAQVPSPMAGDTSHPTQYREAMAARVREMSAQGLSNRKIAAQLNAERVPTLKGDIGRWHHSTIADLLAQG